MNVGLLGLGTVGSQVAERLLAKRDAIRERTGVDLNLRRVLVRDLERPRTIPAGLTTGRADEILDDPEIQLIVEVMGDIAEVVEDTRDTGGNPVLAQQREATRVQPRGAAVVRLRAGHVAQCIECLGGKPGVPELFPQPRESSSKTS